jgi:pheromone shutdown protein TraB
MALPTARVQLVGTRLSIIGTVHVDPASTSLVRDTVKRVRPEVVALELDQARLDALQNPSQARLNGSVGPSFLAMVLLEKFAGRLTGSPPGAEMVQALDAARSVESRVELIDLPIGVTMAGIKKLPLREKLRIGVDSVASLVVLPFGKVDFSDLTEGVDSQLRLFRNRYPALSRLLLDNREKHMAKRLGELLDKTTGPIVAVVGFGHMASLATMLSGYQERPAFSTSTTWTMRTLLLC